MAIERFLVVDDAEANTLFFQVLLKELGYEKVESARGGAEALETVKNTPPHFVITAWEMEAMPGTVFMQRVKASPKRKHLPFLIYSKRMQDEDLRLAKDYGLENILRMPFDRAQAKEFLGNMIEAEDNLPKAEQTLRKIERFVVDNRPTDALALFDWRTNAKGPNWPRSRTLMAQIWVQTNKLDRAEKCLGEALDYDAKYTPAIQLLARVYSLTGRHEEAIKTLESLSQASPKNVLSLVSLGSAYAAADQNEKAKEVFQSAGALDEDNQKLKDEKGKLAFKEGDFDLATQLLSETEDGDEIARTFNNMAIALVAKGDFDKGVETYEAAMRILASKAKLHLLRYNLGLAYRKKGDLEQSFQHLVASYLMEPTFEKAYAGLARVFKEIKASGGQPPADLVGKVKQARAAHQEAQNAQNASTQQSA